MNTWHKFLYSEENQKKYGFSIEEEDGICSIFYDGNVSVLIDAAYGSTNEDLSEPDSERDMRLRMKDGQLFARLPKAMLDCAVKICIGTEDTEEPFFSIVTEDGDVLTQLSLRDPAYYPDEESCLYSIDLEGLTVLNEYVNDNFDKIIEEWNSLHPGNKLDVGIPLSNYRYLASEAYLRSKRAKAQ